MSLAASAENSIMFEQANQLYQNKFYDSAATLFQQMIDEGYHHEIIYYNAGNAYYKANKIGMAIWCYQKALQKNNTKITLDNLQLAKNKIQHPINKAKKIFFIQWWKKLQLLFTINQWSILSLLSFITFIVIQFYQILKKQKIYKTPKIALLFIAIFGILVVFTSLYENKNNYKAIVIQNTPAYSLNNWLKVERTVSDGTEVTVQSANAIYKNPSLIKVVLPNESTVFINKNNILKY